MSFFQSPSWRLSFGAWALLAGSSMPSSSAGAPPNSSASGPTKPIVPPQPMAIGCGGSIGFVGPLAELFGGAPALLMGIEDPASNAHAPNESLHEGDFKKLMASLVRLFDNLGRLTPATVR